MTKTNYRRPVGLGLRVKILLLSSALVGLQRQRCCTANGYEADAAARIDDGRIVTANVDGMGIVAGNHRSFGDAYCPPCMEDHCAVCASMPNFTCCVDPMNNITLCVRSNETASDSGCPAEFCGCAGGTTGAPTLSPRPTTAPQGDSTSQPTQEASTPSPGPPASCDEGEMEVVISILTDPYPRETHWNITRGATITAPEEEVVASVQDGELLIPDHNYETSLCLSRLDDDDEPLCYGFTIGDTGGDGICCVYGLGEYALEVDGSTVAEGGEFEFREQTVYFGECGTGGGDTSSPSQVPSSSSSSFSSQPDGGGSTNGPTSPPSTSHPTRNPTATPSSAEPSPAPTPGPSSKAPTPMPSSASPTPLPTGDPTTQAPSVGRTPRPTSSNPTPQPSPNSTPQPTSPNSTPEPTSPNSTPRPTVPDSTPEPTGPSVTPRPSLSAKPTTEAPTSKRPTAQPTTPAPPECANGNEMSVVVLMRTDRYPQESDWKITAEGGQGAVVTSSRGWFGEDFERETNYSASMCLDGGDCYAFVVEDSFGDGLCCDFGEGGYSLHADGHLLARGGEFKGNSDEATYFGRCCNGTMGTNVGCDKESTEAPTAAPTTPPTTLDPTSQPSSAEPSPDPTPRPTSSPQSTGTTAQPSPNPPPDCGASEMAVTVSLTTDRNPWENYWEITTDGGGDAVATSGDRIGALEAESRHDATVCLPRDACYHLVVVDTESDGLCCKWGLGEYSVAVDGEVVGSGARFGQSDTTQFGTCCSEGDLETTFEDNNGSAGNMFDVLALTDVSIGGFDFHTVVNGSGVEAEVYTKAGSYKGHEQDEAAWTLVMSTRKVMGRGMGVGTPLGCLNAPVSVAANSTQAFYVTSTSSVVRYTNLNRGVIAVKSNDDIKVSMGCGNEYKFGASFHDRAWNGVLKYSLG